MSKNDENLEMTAQEGGQVNAFVSPDTDDIKRMRETSGTIRSDDKLVCFIYQLGRDHLSLGKIEEIMMNIKLETTEYTYTNGWLAQYAQDVVNRLKSG